MTRIFQETSNRHMIFRDFHTGKRRQHLQRWYRTFKEVP